jgi:DNA-binding LacI/PurR family transcriptional regulator
MCVALKKFTEKDIISEISKFVIDNDLVSGTPIAPAKKLAKRYNVCTMTINRAMDKLVKKGLIYRVRGSGTFVAERRKSSKSYNIAMFMWPGQRPDFDETNNAAYGIFSDYIIREFHSQGHDVKIFYDSLFLTELYNNGRLEEYDALIVAAGMVNEKTSSILLEYGCPVIMIQDDKVSEYPFDQIVYDYSPGFSKALEYLASKGHKKIIILGSYGETSSSRRNILSKVAARMGFEVVPFIDSVANATQNSLMILLGRSLGKAYLEQSPEGAVFSLSDLISFGFVDVLKENKFELGKDIDFVSYDDLEGKGLAPFGKPIITSVEHPLLESARQTVKLLFSSLKEKESVTTIIRVPANKFIIRETA